MLLIVKICLNHKPCIWLPNDISFSKHWVVIQNVSSCWNLHPRRGKWYKTHYFRFVAQICSIHRLKVQFPMNYSFYFGWYFNLKRFLIFSVHFSSIFTLKDTIIAFQNIYTAGDSVFMTWTSNKRPGIWFPSLLCR